MPGCSHEAYEAAYEAVSTLEDAARLAGEGGLGLSYDALVCILSQKTAALTKTTMGRHREAGPAYAERFQRGEALLDIARDVRLPPTMLARVVLEHSMGLKKGKEVGHLIKRPDDIPDPRMREEVAIAVRNDPHYGPSVDVVKRLTGLEYEGILTQALRGRGIPFRTEDDLRAHNEAKTPDVLLPVPLLIHGRQVHWIDSKATFGDPTSHAEYHATQFTAYLNRFDAGLVIYWFGFDESVDTDPRVLLLDALPSADLELMSHLTCSTLA